MAMMHDGLSFLQSLSRPALVGMIHVGALPGTPRSRMSVSELAWAAVQEAAVLSEGGVDAIAIENMHDVPYLNRNVGPEVVAAMTTIAIAVRQATDLPLGIQVLAGANREAIAVAHAADLQFVRCEGFAFAHVADEGLMPEADAGPLLRFRRAIGAERIAVIADIKKKHSAHAITEDVSLAETAKAAVFMGADGVVVTGAATGMAAKTTDLQAVTEAIDQAVFIGSGVDPDIAKHYAAADGWIVGSYLKRDGHWEHPPELERVRQMADVARSIVR